MLPAGDMPADYRLVASDSSRRSYLDLWVKMDPARVAARSNRALDLARSLARWCGFDGRGPGRGSVDA